MVVEAEEGGRPVGQGQAELRLAGGRREDGPAVESQGGLAVAQPVLLVAQLSVQHGLAPLLPDITRQLREGEIIPGLKWIG